MRPTHSNKRKRWNAIVDRIDVEKNIEGVEVGVWRGIMSRELFALRPNLKLHLVDPWKTGEPGTDWWESGSVMPARPQELYDAAYKRALQTTEFASDRRVVHHMNSVEAAEEFKAKSLDFVFIDGDHSFSGVVADIVAWLPKIKTGGWIGGHDWDKPQRGKVTEAVRACFPDIEIELDAESTWFIQVKRGLKAVDPRAKEGSKKQEVGSGKPDESKEEEDA